jgi:hypothetical protein
MKSFSPIRVTVVRLSCCLSLFASYSAAADQPARDQAAPAGNLAFVGPENGEYHFDTGVLRGVLHGGGRSTGLLPVADVATGKVLTKSMGWLSPYRLLATGARYGTAAWDWPSQTERLPDGAVQVRWSAHETYPWDMTAAYRWKTADTADLCLTVTARKELAQFEVFVGSYFEGFRQSFVYARAGAGGQPTFVPAARDAGVWQTFPRDDEAAKRITDGRWQCPPSPVTWTIRDRLAAPLAMRRNPDLGLTALVMAPTDDCFAVFTPHAEEGHGSLYLSLLGRDLKNGESATARVRLVIGRDISDEQAVKIHEEYVLAPRL